MTENQATQSSRRASLWFIAPVIGGSSEVWMHRQATGMPRLRVRVMARRVENPDAYPLDRVEIQPIPPKPDGPTSLAARAATRVWRSWANRGEGGFLGSRSEAQWWRQQTQANRPDVALIHYGPMAVEVAPLLIQSGIPVAAHFNGFDLSSALTHPRYRRRLAALAPRLSACVVVADYMRSWLLEHGVPASRVHKVPYGVPLASLPVADRVGESPCRFIAVGRLVAKKRPDLTLRAFAACLESGGAASLTVIGDGPMLEECTALADQLGVSRHVEFQGSRPFDHVQASLKNAGAFVQHSVTADNGDKEGWPVAVAEAAGCGLPVISTRHASIPEQVEHGVTGLLCDEGDWRAMGEHMLRMATSPAERVEMGRAAREKLSAFDVRRQVGELEQILLACASGSLV